MPKVETVSADGRYITLDHRAIDDRYDDYGDNDCVEGASSMNINCAIQSVIDVVISVDNDSGSCNTTFGVTRSAGEDGFSGSNARRRGP